MFLRSRVATARGWSLAPRPGAPDASARTVEAFTLHALLTCATNAISWTVTSVVTPAIAACLITLIAQLPVAAAANAQEFHYPHAICASDGLAWVADLDMPGIWRLDGVNREVVFRAAKHLRTPLNRPRAVALDREGHVLAADSSTRQVYRLGPDGKAEPLVTSEAGIGTPMGLAVNKAGDILVADIETDQVFKVPANGGEATLVSQVRAPRALWVDKDDQVWIISHGPDHLLKLDGSGKPVPVVKGKPFNFPLALVTDDAGTAYVSDNFEKTIWKVTPEGKVDAWVKGEPLVNPSGLAWLGANLLVADSHAKTIFQIDPAGMVTVFAANSAQ